MRHVLTSLDVRRDGGSISATFTSDDRVVRTLLFKVNLAGPESKKDGYLSPFLEERVPTAWTNPITGHVYDEAVTTRKATTWAESARILSELESQAASLATEHGWVFREMEYAAANEGRSPRDT